METETKFKLLGYYGYGYLLSFAFLVWSFFNFAQDFSHVFFIVSLLSVGSMVMGIPVSILAWGLIQKKIKKFDLLEKPFAAFFPFIVGVVGVIFFEQSTGPLMLGFLVFFAASIPAFYAFRAYLSEKDKEKKIVFAKKHGIAQLGYIPLFFLIIAATLLTVQLGYTYTVKIAADILGAIQGKPPLLDLNQSFLLAMPVTAITVFHYAQKHS